jgi:hypothetical protein
MAAIAALVSVLAVGAAWAQGPGGYNPIGPGVSLDGNWGPVFHEDAHERGPGPELVNYLGLPITEGARMYGLAWDASRFTIPEHQCEVHIVSYIYRGPYNLRIWEERDPVSQKLIAISRRARFGWTTGRIPPTSPHIPGWDFPRESGRATSLPSKRRI